MIENLEDKIRKNPKLFTTSEFNITTINIIIDF